MGVREPTANAAARDSGVCVCLCSWHFSLPPFLSLSLWRASARAFVLKLMKCIWRRSGGKRREDEGGACGEPEAEGEALEGDAVARGAHHARQEGGGSPAPDLQIELQEILDRLEARFDDLNKKKSTTPESRNDITILSVKT